MHFTVLLYFKYKHARLHTFTNACLCIYTSIYVYIYIYWYILLAFASCPISNTMQYMQLAYRVVKLFLHKKPFWHLQTNK